MASTERGKPRGRSGWRLRRISTAIETRMKAKSVPMLERSASVPMSNMPAGIATKNPATQVATSGVRNLLCTRENAAGSRPSRDMANHTRAWPSWNTRIEEIMPISAPAVTQRFTPLSPIASSASATGAAVSSLLQCWMPVRTSATAM